MVAEPTSMTSSQKLSWSAGQWYLVRTRCTTTSSMVLSVDAIVGAEAVDRMMPSHNPLERSWRLSFLYAVAVTAAK
jgi:hypothetical protein